MTPSPKAIEHFLNLLRGIAPNMMRQVYTRGGCYRLYLILRERFPEARAYWSFGCVHVVTKIGRRFYDINGETTDKISHALTAYDHRTAAALHFDEVYFFCQLAQLKVVDWCPAETKAAELNELMEAKN